MELQARWYGVSTGDGNDGVSHMFPDYYVFTDKPWTLAERAAQADLKAEFHEQIELREGSEEDGVTAELYTGELDYCEYILEVFPVEDEEVEKQKAGRYGRPCYDSIAAALD